MIQLAFVVAAKTGSIFSQMIAKASHSQFSHVELWCDGPRNAARCFSSREPGGAAWMIRDLTTPEWEIVPIPRAFYDGTQDRIVEAFCWGADGKDYDMLGLIGYKLGNGLHDDDDVFCSEVVSACLSISLGIKLPKNPWIMSPGDLYALMTQNV